MTTCRRFIAPAIMLVLALALSSCGGDELPSDVIYSCDEVYKLYRDSLVESDGTIATATSSMHIVTRKADGQTQEWRVSDISTRYPRATLGMKLPDALYNLAVSELGRDTSATLTPMAIMLSMAMLDPERSMASLRSQVKNGRIASAPDEAWPVCATRVAWILAAWEVYMATGDEEWAREMAEVARHSLRDDTFVNYRSDYELFSGGAVPLSERTDYYPGWMDVKDVYESMSLTINAMYVKAYSIMAQLAGRVGDNTSRYSEISAGIARAINRWLWNPEKGRYSQYLYGTFPVQSPVSDNIGQSLCVIYGVSTPEMTERLFENTPVTPYGIEVLYPSPGGNGLYSNVVRADCQALHILAAAKSRNSDALLGAIAAQYRSAAVNVSPAPMTQAYNGELWAANYYPATRLTAAAARLSTMFRVFAGMSLTPQGIMFAPVVPRGFDDEKFITGLHYRDSHLSIVVHGTGDRIARFSIDGIQQPEALFPADLAGHHSVEITLANNKFESKKPRIEDASVGEELSAAGPRVELLDERMLIDRPITDKLGRGKVALYINGVVYGYLQPGWHKIPNRGKFSYIAAATRGKDGNEGYIGAPVMYIPSKSLTIVEADSCAVVGTPLIADRDIAARYVEMSATVNTHLAFEVELAEGGDFLIDIRYANGAGTSQVQDQCAIRTVLVNGDRAGAVIMPQLGADEWMLTRFSSPVTARLESGSNTVAIDYVVPYNINSAGSESTVLIDYIRLIKIQ